MFPSLFEEATFSLIPNCLACTYNLRFS